MSLQNLIFIFQQIAVIDKKCVEGQNSRFAQYISQENIFIFTIRIDQISIIDVMECKRYNSKMY
jgi:hypothetical protein